MQRCVSQPVAICTITVTAKIDSVWDIAAENRLIDTDGAPIPAASMIIGGQEFSVPSRNAQRMPAGVPTKIDLKFRSRVEPAEVKVLMIYVGHWSAKTIRLEPNWVR